MAQLTSSVLPARVSLVDDWQEQQMTTSQQVRLNFKVDVPHVWVVAHLEAIYDAGEQVSRLLRQIPDQHKLAASRYRAVSPIDADKQSDLAAALQAARSPIDPQHPVVDVRVGQGIILHLGGLDFVATNYSVSTDLIGLVGRKVKVELHRDEDRRRPSDIHRSILLSIESARFVVDKRLQLQRVETDTPEATVQDVIGRLNLEQSNPPALLAVPEGVSCRITGLRRKLIGQTLTAEYWESPQMAAQDRITVLHSGHLTWRPNENAKLWSLSQEIVNAQNIFRALAKDIERLREERFKVLMDLQRPGDQPIKPIPKFEFREYDHGRSDYRLPALDRLGNPTASQSFYELWSGIKNALDSTPVKMFYTVVRPLEEGADV